MASLFILNPDEVEAIHLASLRLLNEAGVLLAHTGIRKTLSAAGASLREDRVLLPPDLIEHSLSTCPSKVAIRGRSGGTVTLGDGSLHWHNVGGASHVFEPGTGQRRSATIQDVRDSARLLDALDGVTNITPFFTPQDVPGPLMSLAMYRHALPYTTKPLQGPGIQTADEVRYAVRMARVVGPPNQVLSLSVSPISPLYFPDDIAESIVEIASQGVPFAPLPCPTAGATSPLSLAGALAQQNAELLACIVLAQVIRPGLPIVYCGRLSAMEPRTGVSVWGGVELGLLSAATVQIGHRYGLPVNVYGFSTNANMLDFQSGYERSLNAVMAAMAGADELSGVGEMSAGVLGSYAQMVCDDEIIGSIGRLRRGIVVDDDSLAVDLIGQVMDGTRNFLDQMHTVRYLRAGELFLPGLAGRRSWDEWNTEGRQLMVDRAQAKAERILAEHRGVPLTGDQERELDGIMHQAETALVSGRLEGRG